MKKIKLKKRKNKLRIRRKLVLTSTLVLLFVIGIGYSFLSINLSILGNITVRKSYGKTLYEVLEKESFIGGLAKEYTREHHDSFTEEPSKKIYHWYANNEDEGAQIKNKYNVIFANHCWQMIRTTDTGGVKLLYNGEPENNQCLDTRGNHVGYNNNSDLTLSTSYYYGTSFSYDKTNNVFSLDGTVTTGSINVGQYTCRSTSSTGTCETLYFVNKLNSGTTYNVLQLTGNTHYSQIGVTYFTGYPLSNVGYMTNIKYDEKEKDLFEEETILHMSTISSLNTIWYSDEYIVNPDNTYKLVNPKSVSLNDDLSDTIGKYTFFRNNESFETTYLNYVESYTKSSSTTTFYFMELREGYDLNHYVDVYSYGDSYTDNGNGTYTINNANTFDTKAWYDNYNNIKNNYYCINSQNNTCSDLKYSNNSTDKLELDYSNISDKYKFSNGFSFINGRYILNENSAVTKWNFEYNNISELNNAHYTCFNLSGECENLYYVYAIITNVSPTAFHIILSNGKSINDAINEMLYNDDVNLNDSTMKNLIDRWYQNNLIDYTSYLEDSIFCGDRRFKYKGGWDPNGGNIDTTGSYAEFYGYYSSSTDLKCYNDTDKFSLSNNKAKLNYPVALLTAPEINLSNSIVARTTGQYYYLLTPMEYSLYSGGASYISPNGRYGKYGSIKGIRPAISLKPGMEYISGTGRMDDPYVVNTFQDDDWATIVNNVRNGNTDNYQVGDTKTVDMGEFGTHTLRLVNKSTPSECKNSDFSQTACGFVVEFADIITTNSMNPNYTNIAGWSATPLRTYVNNDIYNALPSELKGGIIDTKVVSTRGSNNDSSISTDKMFLQTIKELYGLNILDTFGDNTRQLDYYSNLGITGGDIRVARKYNEYTFSNYRYFWLRSALTGSTAKFYIVNSDGMYGTDFSSNYWGVSPAFRIG